MGIESGFDFESEADVFREYARMTSINHDSPLLLDISELADISDDEYQHWTPARWPLNEDAAPYRNGRFSTASGRANFLVTKPNESDKADPTWWLNTGRHRDQWHTMTRTGHIEHLSELDPEPTLYLNSLSGEMLGVSEGELVKIQHPTLAEGSIVYAKAKWDKGLNAKQVFMSMHCTGCYSTMMSQQAK